MTDRDTDVPVTASRRVLRQEVLLVLALSIAASAIYAVLSFIASATAEEALRSQSTVLVSSRAPGRPWIDLGYQLARIVLALAPVALAWHFLARGGESLRSIGADLSQPGKDLVRGVALAAIVGGTGLALYLAAYAAGINLTVVPTSLPDVWWRAPVLVLLSIQNALLEEVLLAGFVLHRLQQLGWSPWRAVAVSAVLRASYHLYQGHRWLHWQPRDGRAVRAAVPAVGTLHAARGSPCAHRHRRVPRLDRSRRPSWLAAGTAVTTD